MQYIPFDKGVNNLYIRISMPIIKSAKKRVKTAAKAKARNVRTKRTLREALKAFAKAVDVGKAADIQKAQAEAISALDTAAKKAPAKPAAKPKKATKAPAKKPAAKKTSPKK
jgi:ribosomal protein S20